MALDLFVNNERYSNSSLFYRVTSIAPSTFAIKLSDLSLPPNAELGGLYYATYSINRSTPIEFVVDNNGLFILTRQFNTNVPCVCSIGVYVSSSSIPVATYEMSAVFVPYFPTVDFIAYPSLYVNVDTGVYQTITSSNYSLSSRGLYFYGEGHTEIINLSCIFTGGDVTANWLIGNSISDIVNDKIVATKKIVNKTSSSTANVSISTDVGTVDSVPISVWATNSYITTAGPIITYGELLNQPMYYPFFTSSLSANRVTKVSRRTKSNIEILPYPDSTIKILSSPFPAAQFILPVDYTNQSFTAVSQITSIHGAAMNEVFSGTVWQLTGFSLAGEWIGRQTPFLSGFRAYNFKLSYEQDTGITLQPFKTSPIFPTTLSLAVSSYRDIFLDLPPYDWKRKNVPTVNTTTVVVNAIPFNKIFTPKYFNVKGEDVSFTIIGAPEFPLEIDELTLSSPYSSETLTLNKAKLTGTMKFNSLGVIDLSATAILKNTLSQEIYNTSVVYQDMLEIVNEYDVEANEAYFHTETTPFKITYTEPPLLSPNEWVVADNINNVFEQFYNTIEEVDSYSTLYLQKNKFYGYLEPAEKIRVLDIPDRYIWENPPKLWVDLDCTDGTVTEDTASWTQWESEFPNIELTWAFEECGRVKIDPSCFQRYCVKWNWRWRTKGSSDVDITWKETKLGQRFQKRWYYEKCVIDAPNLNCTKNNWYISTIDIDSFPLISPDLIYRCNVIDVDVNQQTDQIVLAHPTEINLFDKDYVCTHRARNGMADELFSFQNIVGLETNKEGKVIVLDNVIPRVCVYVIDKNDFVPFTNWGGYGTKENSRGFNRPLDVHVDADNSVWIADTGNNCIKKFTLVGKPLMTITHELLDLNPPLSVCVDSQKHLHCLTNNNVIVFNEQGEYAFEYSFHTGMDGPPTKINVSYNKETIYIAYQWGVAKYFRNGTFYCFIMKDYECQNGDYLQGFNSIAQDMFRNTYVTVGDKVLLIPDLQQVVKLKSSTAESSKLRWKLEELKVHKEEYVQPWVYLKSFHRLWDNIEILRNSIFYSKNNPCKMFTPPAFQKTDLIIGQNEIVTNATINRLTEQLWTNLQSVIKYFDTDCKN